MNINPHDSRPLYLQVYEFYRDQILDDIYPAGMKLPPIRKLASDLGVSRNTIEAAYNQLSQEGFITSKRGSGYLVESIAVGNFTQGVNSQDEMAYEVFMKKNRYSPPSTSAQDNYTYDFTYGNLEPGSFPADIWRKLTAEVLFNTEAHEISRYNDNRGDFHLRLYLAHHLQETRGVQCFPEQIIIQPGTQAALQNLLMLFDPICDRIAMEDPGYDGARMVFENHGFKAIPIPILGENHVHPRTLAKHNLKLVFTTPSNQFPTGKILPILVRRNILEWAAQNDAYIIEDDYCREFRYKGHVAPSLHSLDTHHRVIYLGTFSKALSPAMRISYLVLPAKLLAEWNKKYRNYYSQVPWLSQAVLRHFAEKGYWEKLMRKSQTRNKKKYEKLIAGLRKYLGDKIDIMESGAGLHVLVGVRDDRDQETLVTQAKSEGVRVYETKKYWIDPDPCYENYVLIGFSAIKEEDIDPGIQALAKAWFG